MEEYKKVFFKKIIKRNKKTEKFISIFSSYTDLYNSYATIKKSLSNLLFQKSINTENELLRKIEEYELKIKNLHKTLDERSEFLIRQTTENNFVSKENVFLKRKRLKRKGKSKSQKSMINILKTENDQLKENVEKNRKMIFQLKSENEKLKKLVESTQKSQNRKSLLEIDIEKSNSRKFKDEIQKEIEIGTIEDKHNSYNSEEYNLKSSQYQSFKVPVKKMLEYDISSRILCCCYNKLGNTIAAGCQDGSINLIVDYKEISPLKSNYRRSVSLIDFSHNNKYILSVENSTIPSIQIWNTVTEHNDQTITGNKRKILDAKFFDYSFPKIVSTGYDRTIKIFDVIKGKEINTINNIGGSINNFCVKGSDMYTCHKDGAVKLFDLRSGELVCENTEEKEEVTSICCCFNKFCTTTKNSVINVFDLRYLHKMYSLNHKKFRDCSSKSRFSSDGEYIIVGSKTGNVLVFSIKDKKCKSILNEHESSVVAIDVNPKNQLVLSAGFDKKIVVYKSKDI